MADENERPILEFDRVTVAFEGELALDDVSFVVPKGETRVIFGAAGSGKTVLIKTALGLVRPDSGRVVVFGDDITRMRERDLFAIRSKIGVLFQEGGLFDSLTIEENVGYPLVNLGGFELPPEEVRSRAEEALRFVELEHTLDKFPSELSGGMRRRVGIARAVVTEPPLVLYDSPTAGLDPITSYTIITLVMKERELKNTTTLMVTHRFQDGHLLATAKFDTESGLPRPVPPNEIEEIRTKFLVLREGRLVFEGTLAELEASTDSYIQKFVRREE
ncbi:MAG TPA: ATP-binding cassette domain-containing protein [Bryobacteraceae bacterium]|nr:ATP-binding cassette domain-containing protein [Bryobacteraceae bacterium]